MAHSTFVMADEDAPKLYRGALFDAFRRGEVSTLAVAAAKKGATLGVVAVHKEAVPVDLLSLMSNEITILGSMGRQFRFSARRLNVLAEGVHATGAQLAVLHLGHPVLPDADQRRQGRLGEARVFAQFAQAVLRDLTVDLSLDSVDAVAVTWTPLAQVIEGGHRYQLEYSLGLAPSEVDKFNSSSNQVINSLPEGPSCALCKIRARSVY